MYLKRLEMSGFKSFADKINLKFSEGITAIIGPNGSGKSNVVDAIKWVLGEQSVKSLRGNMMEDVLYKGNESRRASNIASVSITLRNDTGFLPIDFNEVSLARKLYKSGDSEYLINNNPARLKDIIDLISDSGMSKTGYSILSQGEIDMILKNNPVDRRVIFEEAAGIIRFKNRKRMALNKLKSVDEDLLRLNDIIIEKERYLNSLKRQVAKARKYRELKNNLLDKVRKAYKIELGNLIESKEKSNEVIKTLNDKIASVQADISKEEADLELRREELSKLRDDIISRKKIIEEYNQKIQSKEIELNNIKNRRENNEIQKTRLKNDLYILTTKIEELNKNINDLNNEKENYVSQKNIFEEKLCNIKDEFESKKSYLESIKYEWSVIKKEYDGLSEDKIRLEQQLLILNNELKSDKERKNEILVLIDEKENYLNELSDKIDTLKKDISEAEEYIQNLKESITKCNFEIEELKENKMKVISEINETQKEVGHISGLIKSLEDLNSSYEGYLNGVKYFLQNRDKFKFKIFADDIEVEKTYESIIENFMSESLQSLIIDNYETLNKYYEEIQNNKLNNVYFFLKDIVENYSYANNNLSNSIKNENGFVAFASEVVKCSEALKSAKNILLNNVVIFNNLDNIIDISKKYADFKFLTVTGDVYSKGLIILKKSVKSAGIIKRKRELKENKNKLYELENELSILSKREQKVNDEIIDKEYYYKKLNDKFNDKNYLLRDLCNELKTYENEIIKTKDEIKILNDKIFAYKKKEEENSKYIENCEKKYESLSISIEEKNNLYLEKEEAIQETTGIIDVLKDEVYKCELNFNSYDEKIKSLQSNIQLFEHQLQSNKSTITNNQKEIISIEENIIHQKELFQICNNDIEELVNQKNKISMLLQEIYNEENDKQKQLNFINKDIEENKLKRDTLKEEVHKAELKLNNQESHIDSLKTIAREKYTLEIDFDNDINQSDELKEAPEENVSLEELKEDIKNIELKIERIGSVNVDAITEYEELNKEYEFIMKQKHDLEEAAVDLKKLIRKIDKESKVKFVETFEQANNNFKKIISDIFDGGEGELILVDEEDVLESGIDIVVRMRGKRFQTISLLSGGERALVSIALLFSLLEIKPAPFCVLDEIDAPLDDANIMRFIKLVGRFKNKTQFIVITHNKLTMEMCDTIYGVTMEELGVSKILSFKFENKREKMIAN